MKRPTLFLMLGFLTLVFLLSACSPSAQTSADGHTKIGNPAAVYCREMGFTYQTIVDAEGGESGVCQLPDNAQCDAWDFLSGQCGAQYSYCAQNGYQTLTLNDGGTYAPQHAVCVDSSGKTLGAVEELSDLPVKLTSCGSDTPSTLPAREPPAEVYTPDIAPEALPAAFDWRNNNGNWLTPVRDQGSCGSCWAFSAVGVTEAAMEIAANNPDLNPNLSEQYLVSDCLTSIYGYQNCCGGWEDWALEFIRDEGIPDEACMTYVDGSGCTCYDGSCDSNCNYRTGTNCSDRTCTNRCTDWASRLTKVEATGFVGTSHTNIKTALIEKGPLTAALYMDGSFQGDVYKCSTTKNPNHAVVLVGYNDAGGYWIVRNSWGSVWNYDGYFKVGYDQCHIDDYVYYATVAASPQPPAAFSKGSPVDGTDYLSSQVKLSWNASNGAESYEVCADTTNNNTCDNAWTSTGTTTSHTLTALTPGTYYWQARAVNKVATTDANTGAWWSFTVRALHPAFDEQLTTSKVTFDWDDFPGAVSYKIKLSEYKDFNTLVFKIGTPVSTYAYSLFLKPATTYYWQVRPIYPESKGAWSPVYRFRSMDPLAAPALTSPGHKDYAPSPVTLTWQGVERAGSYLVVIAKDAAFVNKVGKLTTTDLSALFNQPAGKYYWRVRALDTSGGKGPWSQVRIVKVP